MEWAVHRTVRGRVRAGLARSIALPAEEREDQAQDDANNNAGDDREIERGVSPLNPDVAGQTAQPTGAEAAP